MSKRFHPIRKMRQALAARSPYLYPDESDVLIARHVKPLLDALEEAHSPACVGWANGSCRVCRLLAAWKEPLK